MTVLAVAAVVSSLLLLVALCMTYEANKAHQEKLSEWENKNQGEC